MSYLLEALRKSERERQQKTAVPDLQTPTVEWEAGDEARQRSPWLTVAVIAICLNTLLLAVLVWRFGFAGNDNIDAGQQPAIAPAKEPGAAVSTVSSLPPVIVVQQPAATNDAIVVRDRSRPEPARNSSSQLRPDEYNAGSRRTVAPSAGGTEAWTGRDAVNPDTGSKGERGNAGDSELTGSVADDNNGADSEGNGAADDAVPSIHSLPINIRQELPMLTMNSHIYASNARDSFVMINGSSFSPGQEITAGLKLVAVVPEGAVLVFKGHRFLLPALASFSP